VAQVCKCPEAVLSLHFLALVVLVLALELIPSLEWEVWVASAAWTPL
jgi:hypothetical protein|tara:strand:- start:279 stop:419 length:141 start_codon:yes stop_codon:yes gene_type:complete